MLDAFVLASALVAVAAGRCAEPPRIASGVAALHGEVAEAESFKLSEIEEMARQSGAVLAHPRSASTWPASGTTTRSAASSRSAPTAPGAAR